MKRDGAHNSAMRAPGLTCFVASLAFVVGGCSAGGGGDETTPDQDASVDTNGSGGDVGRETHPLFDGDNYDAVETGACPGVGVRCGGPLGLDPTKLYTCTDGKVTGVSRTCTGTCVAATDGTMDRCPCPDGDGTYCGDRVGGDAKKLYACKDGVISAAAICEKSCTAGTTATSDKCAACEYGDGLYCGAVTGDDPDTLYQCTGGVLTVKQKCAGACIVEPPGTNDKCPPCPSGDGDYCGGPVGLDPNTLYTCTGGVFTEKEKCATTCFVAPPGSPDYCTTAGSGLLCSSLQWWNSSITYGPYTCCGGWWDTDLAVGDSTKVQLRHDSQLYKTGVYGWGYMPEFIDMVTGKKFRFLHLHPSAMYATTVGKTYPAGFIVGLSGGGTADTGYGTYSTGPHLCLETLDPYRDVFPTGKDACH